MLPFRDNLTQEVAAMARKGVGHTGVLALGGLLVAMEANHYIHRSNWEKENLSLSKFKSQIYAIEKVEARIAQESNKIAKHHRKWDRIKELL